MIQRRLILPCLFLCGLVAGNIRLLTAQDLTFKLENYDKTDLDTIKASKMKAELEARAFVASPANTPEKVLGPEFFKNGVTKEYPVSEGGTEPIESVGTAGPIVPAIVIAKEMRDLLKDKPNATSAELQDLWLKKQTEVLQGMNKRPNPILSDGTVEVWQQFLLEWMKAAIAKEDFRKALQEASFEIVNALVGRTDVQRKGAQSGPTGAASTTAGGTSGAGAYFPLHERMMNHIYRHNDRRISKAERIRARRY